MRERKKGFFSISEQHEISLVRCAMVGSQKKSVLSGGRVGLTALKVSQESR